VELARVELIDENIICNGSLLRELIMLHYRSFSSNLLESFLSFQVAGALIHKGLDWGELADVLRRGNMLLAGVLLGL